MGGWVGGWVDRWVGGWVGGWEEEDVPSLCGAFEASAHRLTQGIEVVVAWVVAQGGEAGGWVGGWVG